MQAIITVPSKNKFVAACASLLRQIDTQTACTCTDDLLLMLSMPNDAELAPLFHRTCACVSALYAHARLCCSLVFAACIRLQRQTDIQPNLQP